MRAADRKQSKYYKSRKKQFNNRQKEKVDHIAMNGRLWRRRASQQEPSVAAHFKDAAAPSNLKVTSRKLFQITKPNPVI